MPETTYMCLDCGWTGKNVEYDSVDTCMGGDETEMCPDCGSINVVRKFTD